MIRANSQCSHQVEPRCLQYSAPSMCTNTRRVYGVDIKVGRNILSLAIPTAGQTGRCSGDRFRLQETDFLFWYWLPCRDVSVALERILVETDSAFFDGGGAAHIAPAGGTLVLRSAICRSCDDALPMIAAVLTRGTSELTLERAVESRL
jgi:hypothetical protein